MSNEYNAVRVKSRKYHEEFLPRKRRYQHLRRHIGKHVHSASDLVIEPFSLSELSSAIHQLTEFRLRESTLERLCQQYAKKSGVELLTPDPDRPSHYRFTRNR